MVEYLGKFGIKESVMINNLLEERVLQPIGDFNSAEWENVKNEYTKTLCSEEYGYPLPAPTKLEFEKVKPINGRFAAGTATFYKVIAHTEILGKEFSFPFSVVLPNKTGKYPFFVEIDFENGVPNKYFPTEEIINNGFAALHFYYEDVTSDNADMTNGLSGILYPDGERKGDDPGKIMMWSWAAQRVMDYAMTLDCLDFDNAAVIGHSRLGKTALVTGMLDSRFKYVISNDSGCSGASITRAKEGEHIDFITKTFPFWFCKNYTNYVDESKLTFDQHMLLATIAPRTLIVGSAADDTWADPDAEYLGCCAASKAWENLGLVGFVHPNRLPTPGSVFDEGNICYQIRTDGHYLSRRDWNVYFDIIRKKMR